MRRNPLWSGHSLKHIGIQASCVGVPGRNPLWSGHSLKHHIDKNGHIQTI